MKLQEWIDLNRLDAQITSNICTIDGKKFLILENKPQLFNHEFEFNLTEEDIDILVEHDINQVVFEFGNNWYISNAEEGKVELNIFKYIGKEKADLDFQFPYLGIHGEYDLCNGSRLYKDWCKKAKFFNSPSLAICETNTLAGTLSFQMACKDAGIKSILGETVTVVGKDDIRYHVKLYVKNYDGWVNLLNINSQIKVFNEGFVSEEYLLSRSEGLICVLCSDFHPTLFKKYDSVFNADLYYQLDFVEWQSPDKEKEYLTNLKNYIDNGIDHLKPALICDSFYLDKEHGHIKKILNTIGKVSFQHQSIDQYFKSLTDIYNQINELAPSEEWMGSVFFRALEHAVEISDKCNFEIKLGELHLPAYEMTDKESAQFASNQDLFVDLINKGFEAKSKDFVKDEEEYLLRIEREMAVIVKGGFVDYFLILADIINWCKENNILTGIGRGSAAGSVIAYLLDITQIDPLKFNLLFERFLNEGRLGKSLPDIDTDFASDRRDEVKRYMETRYGINHVTSIGTYGTFKIKQGLTDLCRFYNFNLAQTKIITSIIADELSFTDFLKIAAKREPQTNIITNFVQEHAEIIEDYPLIANQVKTSSIHAAGVIIVPKTYNGKPMTIYDWMPVKKMDGVLITEWEGPVLETAGYLKEDILGTKQLQKLSEMMSLIKRNHNKDIIFNEIPLDDQDVFELFQGGYNEDVFQFGAIGLKGYCRKLKPEVIEDLIATVALYRPGPIENGIHESYIKVKNGEREREYDYMMEDATKDTYGLVIYQEQVMKAMEILGGFNLVEADDIRKAMGKKDMEKMEGYKVRFIDGAIEKGCDQYDAIAIWNKLEAFALYSFNKSHAACYAHTGYYCQWIKQHYPLEFWAVTLNFSKQEEIAKRISEMHKVSTVKVVPPDINQSTNIFEADQENNVIYWSIGSIKQIGEKTLESIMKERNEKGKFFSFDDFYNRVEKRTVNKRVIVNLILSGCFDKVEKLNSPKERHKLLQRFLCDMLGDNLPDDITSDKVWRDYFWTMKQKELTGFGHLDFEKIFHAEFKNKINSAIKLCNVDTFQDGKETQFNICVVGILTEIQDKRMKDDRHFGPLMIGVNDENIPGVIWSEIWNEHKDLLLQSVGKVVCITGKRRYEDKYKGCNQLQTTQNDKESRSQVDSEVFVL